MRKLLPRIEHTLQVGCMQREPGTSFYFVHHMGFSAQMHLLTENCMVYKVLIAIQLPETAVGHCEVISMYLNKLY